jgi:hypothetical protein
VKELDNCRTHSIPAQSDTDQTEETHLPREYCNSRLPVFEWSEIGCNEIRRSSGEEGKERLDTTNSLVPELKMHTQQKHIRQTVFRTETSNCIQTAHQLLIVNFPRTIPWWCLEGVGVTLRKFLPFILKQSSRSQWFTYSFGRDLAKPKGVQDVAEVAPKCEPRWVNTCVLLQWILVGQFLCPVTVDPKVTAVVTMNSVHIRSVPL